MANSPLATTLERVICMKKLIFTLTIVLFVSALGFVGCNTNSENLRAHEGYNQATGVDEMYNATNGNDTTTNTVAITSIEWVEDGAFPVFDGERQIGIRYREIDLSQPYISVAIGRMWDEIGITTEPQSDLSQILGQPIATRDEAVNLANQILESEGQIFDGQVIELMSVEYDSSQNIWIFGYQENRMALGLMSLRVAVCGRTGELLRMWILS